MEKEHMSLVKGFTEVKFLKGFENLIGEYPKLCVWGLAHAVETGHLLNRSGYRIANWFRAATHSLTHLPAFSKLRMAR